MPRAVSLFAIGVTSSLVTLALLNRIFPIMELSRKDQRKMEEGAEEEKEKLAAATSLVSFYKQKVEMMKLMQEAVATVMDMDKVLTTIADLCYKVVSAEVR